MPEYSLSLIVISVVKEKEEFGPKYDIFPVLTVISRTLWWYFKGFRSNTFGIKSFHWKETKDQ
jgi:hypothetical protein